MSTAGYREFAPGKDPVNGVFAFWSQGRAIELQPPAPASPSRRIYVGTRLDTSCGIVGTMRDLIRAGSVSIPEDVKGIGDGVPSDPFRRDVYLPGVIAYYLLFLQWPQKQGEIAGWTEPEQQPYHAGITTWLAKALELLPADRYANARVVLDALNSIPTITGRPGLDMKDFEPYRNEILPVVAYPMEENIKQGRCHLYKSTHNGQRVAVKIWHGIRPDWKRAYGSVSEALPEETRSNR